MENYIKNYELFEKKIIYDFKQGWGGIGDLIKFFMKTLSLCIKYNIKLYYKINNISIEKYIKLKYTKMYIRENDIHRSYIIKENEIPNINTDIYNIVEPFIFYNTFNYDDILLNIKEVFYFSEEIKINSHNLLSDNISNYISIHLRLGDKYLETNKYFVICKNDERKYDEEILFKCIEENYNKNVIFFCDNNNYKLKIKNKYNNIIILNSNIGHTSLSNTTEKQILDSVTEFYLLTNSYKIFSASDSGFSKIASKFNNTPLTNLLD